MVLIVREISCRNSCHESLAGKSSFSEFHKQSDLSVPVSQGKEAPLRGRCDGRCEADLRGKTVASMSGQHRSVELSKQLLEQPRGLRPQSRPLVVANAKVEEVRAQLLQVQHAFRHMLVEESEGGEVEVRCSPPLMAFVAKWAEEALAERRHRY